MADASERTRGGDRSTDTAVDAGASTAEAGDQSRLGTAWYRSRLGVAVVAGDALLTVAVVAAASVAVDAPLGGVAGLEPGLVPPFVPLFSLLGALGYVFTTLVERFDASVGSIFRYNLRLPAALPLGVGVFLLSDVVLGQGVDDVPLVAGLVFLSGLYVNLAYKRLAALARRLLPSGRSGRSG